MLSTSQIKKGIKNPSLVFYYLNRNTLYRWKSNTTGINIFDQDWDNLIVLDACRFDYFESIVSPGIQGELYKKLSKGAATREWIEENFAGRNLHDTVYVSANGWYRTLQPEIDSSIFDSEWLYTEEYRNERGTVEPEIVRKKALEFAEKYPNKRLLIHFVQPHKPYLGPTTESSSWNSRNINLVELMNSSADIDDLMLRTAYRETLEYVLPELTKLVDQLEGKTVISADHGELLGERYLNMPLKNYGHAKGIYVPELVEIPWFVCSGTERRRITSDNPKQQKESDETELKEHLRLLGYS